MGSRATTRSSIPAATKSSAARSASRRLLARPVWGTSSILRGEALCAVAFTEDHPL